MMGLARRDLRKIDGLEFWKLCGSGTGEGFTPVPDTTVVAILATWSDLATAKRQIGNSRLFRRFTHRATEAWTVHLSTTTVRGEWSGCHPFVPSESHAGGPVAALTRATIRPKAALRFWSRVPDISAVIGADPNVIFKIGIGEVPWLHQVTFSIWPDTASMAAFARADGPHARAIRAVREHRWFREELYARFRVIDTAGTWNGHQPLARLDIAI